MKPIQQTMFDEGNNRQPRSKASYNAYFQTSVDALLLISDHGAILQANDPFTKLSRYSTRELYNQHVTDLFSQIDEPTPLFPLHKKLRHQPLVSLTTFMRQKTGTRKPIELFICPAHFDDQDKDTFQVLVRKRLAPPFEKLARPGSMNAQSLKSIGALAGGIAHNFNNIMTGLYGNITLAKLESKDRPKALAHLQKAEFSMEEAVRLTRQLLTFAKGGSPLKEHFNPEPLIRNIAALNLAGSGIRLNMSAPKNLWLVHADKKQLEQVVANIVVNARHAMAEKGELSIELENSPLLKDNLLTISKGAHIKVVFRDQGCGIPEKNLTRIFDPYYTTRQDSCGMGLPICYSIISRHKGHISAASQLGKGTQITVYLPAQVRQDTKADDALHTSTHTTPPTRILVMDDDDQIRDITRQILEKSGYSVSLARMGEEAVQMYTIALKKGSPFDLVIMDQSIPNGMGGQEAARKIHEIDPLASLALTSGYPNDPVMANPKAFGLKGFIPKPFTREDLTTAVQKMLT